MIQLERTKDKRWILQKNISSSKLIQSFLETMKDLDNNIDNSSLKKIQKNKGVYHGRSAYGSENTMGVRMSQMCFYMFGYKNASTFIPSPMTQFLLRGDSKTNENILVNLFSMQYPHPFSETDSSFKIYIGRLITKLLLDDRLEYKLYIDEAVWFLPFIKTCNETVYNDLVDSIIEYRHLSYTQKKNMFENVDNYDEVFSNCMHEFNYYFLRIFAGFGVFKLMPDPIHNGGKLFRFHHGNGSTMRSDAYDTNKRVSGYFTFSKDIVDKAKLLIDNYSCFDIPYTQADADLTKSEWVRELYEFEPIKYLQTIHGESNSTREILDTIKNMLHDSTYGSRDGKDFEHSLRNVFELFREVRHTEIISGAGDTDILCKVINENETIPYKINVDAKSTGKTTQSINSKRISLHIIKNNSKYCIIVSPRFAKGVRYDISGEKMVTLTAETLANYCLKECIASEDSYANFTIIDKIIEKNYGTDISNQLDIRISQLYGV